MRGRHALVHPLVIVSLALVTAACGDADAPTAMEDPSKLSAELESEAQQIEERAGTAVREAETLAERELQQLRAEAAAASTADQASAAQAASGETGQ